MKTKTLFLLFALALLLSSCLIKSLHPFYTEKDVVFQKELLGNYTDQDSARWEISQYTFSKGFMKGDSLDNSYLLSYYSEDGTYAH